MSNEGVRDRLARLLGAARFDANAWANADAILADKDLVRAIAETRFEVAEKKPRYYVERDSSERFMWMLHDRQAHIGQFCTLGGLHTESHARYLRDALNEGRIK